MLPYQVGQVALVSAAQHDIRTPPGHVSGDGYPTRIAGLGNQGRLMPGSLPGTQKLVRLAQFTYSLGNRFTGGYIRGADQHRRSAPPHLDRISNQGVSLPAAMENQSRQVYPPAGTMGGDFHYFQAVKFKKVFPVTNQRTAKTGYFLVEPQVSLD